MGIISYVINKENFLTHPPRPRLIDFTDTENVYSPLHYSWNAVMLYVHII